MSAISIIMLVGLFLATALSVFSMERLPSPLRHRDCQGKFWKRAFPDASSGDIRALLELFVFSFAYRSKERLKLHPDDKLLDIYKAKYPTTQHPDALEFEALADELLHEYRLSLESVWTDEMTLGELFAAAQRVSAE